MKKRHSLFSGIVVLFLFMVFAGNVFAQQQDTVLVEPGYDTLSKLVKEQDDAVKAGTANLNRVFKLKRNELYILNGSLRNTDWHLRIIGEKGTAAPAVLQAGITSTGASAQPFTAFGDLTLKNLQITGADELGSIRNQIITISKDNARMIIDNCVLTYCTWKFITNNSNKVKYYFTNTVFRNLMSLNNDWSNGKPFDVGNNLAVDTLVFQNCTFANMVGNIVSGWNKNMRYLKFDHNTVINTLKQPLAVPRAYEAVITNNLFYDAMSYGTNAFGGGSRVITAPKAPVTPDTMSLGFFQVDTLVSDAAMPAANRKIIITKNNYYFSQKIKDFWASSAKKFAPVPFANDSTVAFFKKNTKSLLKDTLNINPQFVTTPPTAITDSLLKFANAYTKTPKPANSPDIKWNPSGNIYILPWPIPENLSYPISNALYTAADGILPLGDLNWFPAKKAQWISGVERLDQDIPTSFELSQNYPNPFNPTTNIVYKISNRANVVLTIYNALGQKVKTLVQMESGPGVYNVNWNGDNNFGAKVGSGIYFYQLIADNVVITKKMMLVK